MIKKILAAAAFAFAMGGAAAEARDYTVTVTYAAPADVQRGEPSVVFGTVTNARESGANWLGAIRGGYGNPLKVLVTETPVHELVAQAVRDGLTARNLASETGAYRLDLRVVRFDCNEFIPKDAHIIIEVTLTDVQSNTARYHRTTQVDRVGGGIGGGIFASVEPLRALANLAMQQAVDQALDDPEFRAVLATPKATQAPPPPA